MFTETTTKQTPPSTEEVTFKVSLDGETRRGRFIATHDVKFVRAKLLELFGLSDSEEFVISYTDPDGDVIVFSSNEEVKEALGIAARPLRFHINRVGLPKAAPVNAGPAMMGPAMMGPMHGPQAMRRHKVEIHFDQQISALQEQGNTLETALAALESQKPAAAGEQPKNVKKLVDRYVHLTSKLAQVDLRLEGKDLPEQKRAKLQAKRNKIAEKIRVLPCPAEHIQADINDRQAKVKTQIENTRHRMETRLVNLEMRAQKMHHKVAHKANKKWGKVFGPGAPLGGMNVPNPFAGAAAGHQPFVDEAEIELSTRDEMKPPAFSPAAQQETAQELEVKYKARFVKDQSIPDGTILEPGQHFTKVWRMRNVGAEAWPVDTRLMLVGKQSDPLGSDSVVPIAETVPAGTEIDLAVPMVAPNEPGRYLAYWRLADSNERKFGQRVWVEIVVATSSSESSATDDDAVVVSPEFDQQAMDTALATLRAMGFEDEKRNRRLLKKFNGNLVEVTEKLLLRTAAVHHAPQPIGPKHGNGLGR
mmetsp:Transcript_132917/g.187811  ORF Transcript_132917/g.187811 Transcript_132917/m.187811 type:complete len:532 (-) Transcript_132917:8-1603(-)